MEVGRLRKRIADFEHKQVEFRKSFQRMRFYQFKCRSDQFTCRCCGQFLNTVWCKIRQPYELMAEANGMIDAMEAEMRGLQVS